MVAESVCVSVCVCHRNKSVTGRQGQTSLYLSHVSQPPSKSLFCLFKLKRLPVSLSLCRAVRSPTRDANYCHVSCLHATRNTQSHTHTHTHCRHRQRWRPCPQLVSWSEPVSHMFVCLRRICQVSRANSFFHVRQIRCRFSVTQVCFCASPAAWVRKCSSLLIFSESLFLYLLLLKSEKPRNSSSAVSDTVVRKCMTVWESTFKLCECFRMNICFVIIF